MLVCDSLKTKIKNVNPILVTELMGFESAKVEIKR